MTTLPNMGLEQPTLGGDIGAWDDKLNANNALIDAHDHTSGKGARITPAAMNVNADLPIGGNGLTGLGRLAFTAVAALVTGARSVFVSDADNELYWRTAGGTNVKLTNGNSLNTSLVGGIGGDYSTVGAELAYVDADATYTFKDKQAPKRWARIASGPVRIYEFNTTETVYVEHAVAAGLASSYTVTWPAALPAAGRLLQVAADGTVSFSNTLPADVGIAISGTARYAHGEKYVTTPVTTVHRTAGTVSFPSASGPGGAWAASTTAYIPLPPLPSDARIKSVTAYVYNTVTGPITYTLAVGTVGFSLLDTGTTTDSSATAVTLTPATPLEMGNGSSDPFAYWLKVETGAAEDVDVYMVKVTYDVAAV